MCSNCGFAFQGIMVCPSVHNFLSMCIIFIIMPVQLQRACNRCNHFNEVHFGVMGVVGPHVGRYLEPNVDAAVVRIIDLVQLQTPKWLQVSDLGPPHPSFHLPMCRATLSLPLAKVERCCSLKTCSFLGPTSFGQTWKACRFWRPKNFGGHCHVRRWGVLFIEDT